MRTRDKVFPISWEEADGFLQFDDVIFHEDFGVLKKGSKVDTLSFCIESGVWWAYNKGITEPVASGNFKAINVQQGENHG